MKPGDRVALRYNAEQEHVSWGTVRQVLPEDRISVDLDSGGWLIVPVAVAEHHPS